MAFKDDNPLLEQALRYAGMGIRIFPLSPHSKIPLISKKEGGHGLHDGTTDPDKIRDWWMRYPNANIGAVCGFPFVAVDVDPVGLETLSQDQIEKMKNGVHQKTPRGGYHFLYKYEGETLNKQSFVPGVDFKGEGGYIVLAPSRVVDKAEGIDGRYTWEKPYAGQLAALPSWVEKFVRNAPKENQQPDIKSKLAGDIADGTRDVTLASRIGTLARSGLSNEDVRAMAYAINKAYGRPPVSNDQVDKIVKSILSRERSKAKDEGKLLEFHTLSFSEMVAKYGEHELAWTIEECLPDATCGIFSSAPGMMKTWFMMDLAVSVATGKPFLGRWKTNKPGSVLIIQQEDPFPMLMNRLTQVMNIGEPIEIDDGSKDPWHIIPMPPKFPNIHFHDRRQLQFSDKEVIKLMEKKIRDLGTSLCIIDPLYSAAETDDYMAHAARDMMFMKSLRDETGCSFFIAHHTNRNKESQTRARDDMWGSQFLNAWLETGWQLKPGEAPNQKLFFRHFKVDEDREPIALTIDIDDYSFEVSQTNKVVHADGNLDERIIKAIKEDKAKSMGQLMSYLGVGSKATVNRAIDRLIISHNVVKMNGKYVFGSVMDA